MLNRVAKHVSSLGGRLSQGLDGFKQVGHIHIKGKVDALSTQHLINQLKNAYPWMTKALVVTINSSGGSAAQAAIIIERLHAYSVKNNVPIYTFAEDECLSAAYMILASGDKVFCDRSSVIGSVGAKLEIIHARKFIKNTLGIDTEVVSTDAGRFSSTVDPSISEKSVDGEEEVRRFVANARSIMANFVNCSNPDHDQTR